MKLFASLDAKDRKLLIGCMCAVAVLAVVTAFFARNEDRDDNPVPSTYRTGKHGARAAYELLQANGYNVERWERPLSDLAAQTDAQTVVIFAAPNPTSPEDLKAVKDIVAQGGRVLLTDGREGFWRPAETPCRRYRRPPASSRRRDSTRWLDRAKCGWFLRLHGERTGRSIASSTTARARQPWWSTRAARAR